MMVSISEKLLYCYRNIYFMAFRVLYSQLLGSDYGLVVLSILWLAPILTLYSHFCLYFIVVLLRLLPLILLLLLSSFMFNVPVDNQLNYVTENNSLGTFTVCCLDQNLCQYLRKTEHGMYATIWIFLLCRLFHIFPKYTFSTSLPITINYPKVEHLFKCFSCRKHAKFWLDIEILVPSGQLVVRLLLNILDT